MLSLDVSGLCLSDGDMGQVSQLLMVRFMSFVVCPRG